MALSHLLRLRSAAIRRHHPFPPPGFTGRLLSNSSSLHHLDLTESRPPPPPPQPLADPKSTLSARMSFVFDQVDALHRDRHEKDEALQRIRAWRHNKQQQQQQQQLQQQQEERACEESKGESDVGAPERKVETRGELEFGSVFKNEVQLVHPWPEWIELMERLLQQNYFDYRHMNEDQMVTNLPDEAAESSEEGCDLTRNWAAVCTACENFGKDRFDILKSLSRKDIEVLVGSGCPSTDGKVVYSAKLLRKHAHVNEGDVCSACSLRSSCRRGFLVLPKEDEARTLDVIRVLLTFAFDSVNGSVKNEPLKKMKSVKTIIRKLLHEIAKLSAVPIDPNLPRPVIKKAPPKVKQPPPPPRKRVGRDDVEMKKGDWLCPKCDFLNFAKNVICLQCDAKRPKRQLLPGEWECPECNFLNYRRNMACFHCECKRPPDEFMENQIHAKQHDSQTGYPKGARKPNISDSWNFDFDENESDGADVAAFEFADSPRDHNGPPDGEVARRFGNDAIDNDRPRIQERRRYFSEPDNENLSSRASRTGFDDFDDEDDDVDSYEIDMADNRRENEISRRNFSELENTSESDNCDDLDRYSETKTGAKTPVLDSEDSDDMRDSDSDVDLSGLSHWKSNKERGKPFCSDDDLNIDSDDDVDQDFSNKLRKEHNRGAGKGSRALKADDRFSRRHDSFRKDDRFSSRHSQRNDRVMARGFDNRIQSNRDDFRDFDRPLRGPRFEDNNRRDDRRSYADGRNGNNRGGRHDSFRKDDRFSSRHSQRNDRVMASGFDNRLQSNRDDFHDFDRTLRGPRFEDNNRRDDRRSYADRRDGNNRGGNSQKFNRPIRGVGFESRGSDDRPRRRIIER